MEFEAERFYRSEEHTSELQSQSNLVCRLLLEKKKTISAASSKTDNCSSASYRATASIPRTAAGSRSCAVAAAEATRPSTFFFFNDATTTKIYTLSLHDALPISPSRPSSSWCRFSAGYLPARPTSAPSARSEEHTSELQSQSTLVCRLLLEK